MGNGIEKLKGNKCPMHNKELDSAKRCLKCKATWAIAQPFNGKYVMNKYPSGDITYFKDGKAIQYISGDTMKYYES
jgi:hypothetical protein